MPRDGHLCDKTTKSRYCYKRHVVVTFGEDLIRMEHMVKFLWCLAQVSFLDLDGVF